MLHLQNRHGVSGPSAVLVPGLEKGLGNASAAFQNWCHKSARAKQGGPLERARRHASNMHRPNCRTPHIHTSAACRPTPGRAASAAGKPLSADGMLEAAAPLAAAALSRMARSIMSYSSRDLSSARSHCSNRFVVLFVCVCLHVCCHEWHAASCPHVT